MIHSIVASMLTVIDRVGATWNLSKPQAFKNVSLTMMIDETLIFHYIFV